MLVDYCGITLAITDCRTGVITEAQVFVACLGASNYTYAEATQSQQLAISKVELNHLIYMSRI
jgi:transposase